MNWSLRSYYNKDIKSDIDENSDAGGVAAGGISHEIICSASCAALLFMCGQQGARVSEVLALEHHCVLS